MRCTAAQPSHVHEQPKQLVSYSAHTWHDLLEARTLRSRLPTQQWQETFLAAPRRVAFKSNRHYEHKDRRLAGVAKRLQETQQNLINHTRRLVMNGVVNALRRDTHLSAYWVSNSPLPTGTLLAINSLPMLTCPWKAEHNN